MDGDVGNESQLDTVGFDLGSSDVDGVLLLLKIQQRDTAWIGKSNAIFGIGLHGGMFKAFSAAKAQETDLSTSVLNDCCGPVKRAN